MKILIVDDDAVNISVLSSALKHDYAVISAMSGEAALRLLRDEAPDLVLLDVMMPGMDGRELFRRMREDAALAETPVIFVTAVDSVEGQQAGLELGAVDYITKPINLKLARLRIRNQIELKRQRDVIQEQNLRLTREKEALEAALARVKRLEGMLSICMYCKKIRAEHDDWQRLETYISDHTDAVFSHGMCPECAREQYEKLEASLRKTT